jgi:hypothetical protein
LTEKRRCITELFGVDSKKLRFFLKKRKSPEKNK